jgi:parallel beta-helix repeat protein
MRHYSVGLLVCGLALTIGCNHENGSKPGAPATKVTRIEPGPEAQEKAIEALINAETGEVIEFAKGTYEFDTTLSLELEDVTNVTIRGEGMEETILNFAKMGPGTGGEGIKVSGSGSDKEDYEKLQKDGGALPELGSSGVRDNVTIENLTVQDSRGDGIKVEGGTGVTFRKVKAEWTRGPNEDNGAYGVYPVLCKDVLVEDCVSIAAADAGIYVGQSNNVIVRGCTAKANVAGIEIENTVGADVYNNTAEGNTGGILVFALPGLPMKNGRHCRVYNNRIIENNIDNFAKPGNIVATVPPGAGLLIMANDEVEVFNNEFKGNNSFNVAVISYLVTQRPFDDPQYDPYAEGIYVHDNKFDGGGEKPGGNFAELAAILPTPLPDILFDGVVNQAKVVDGQLPPELRVWIKNNDNADFANMDLSAMVQGQVPNPSTDAAAYTGELPALKAIEIVE